MTAKLAQVQKVAAWETVWEHQRVAEHATYNLEIVAPKYEAEVGSTGPYNWTTQ